MIQEENKIIRCGSVTRARRENQAVERQWYKLEQTLLRQESTLLPLHLCQGNGPTAKEF